MKVPYTTLAVKYVGSTPALSAVERLSQLDMEGCVSLKDGIAVTRSAGGEVSYYPIETHSPHVRTVGMGIGGFLLGLIVRRRLRCALIGAIVGVGLALAAWKLKQKAMEVDLPYLVKNESLLYMRVLDADWDSFWQEMKPHLTKGKLVIHDFAPGHAELKQKLLPEVATQTATQTEKVADGSETGERVDESSADLRSIRGVGEVVARRLAESGITSFRKLVSMDADQLADVTGIPAARITNEDWSGQAKRLLKR